MTKDHTISLIEFGTAKVTSRAVPSFIGDAPSLILLAEAVRAQSRRSRILRAHTKQRGEVRGGGAKPWRQKGTGRARHASRRSPIWKGGGTVFGPRTRHSAIKKLPHKARVQALRGALYLHVQLGSLDLVQFSKNDAPKTSNLREYIPRVAGLLIVVAAEHIAIGRALRNISHVRVVQGSEVTVRDLVHAQRVWLDEAALKHIERRCTYDRT